MLKNEYHEPLHQTVIVRLAGLRPIGHPVSIRNLFFKQELFNLTQITIGLPKFGPEPQFEP